MSKRSHSQWLVLGWLVWLAGLSGSLALLASGPQVDSQNWIKPPAPEVALTPRKPPSLLAPPDISELVPTLNNRGQVTVAAAADVDPLAAFFPPPEKQTAATPLPPKPEVVRERIAAKQQDLMDDEAFRAALQKFETMLSHRQAKPAAEAVPAVGWGPLINKYARQHGVDARLVWAVMRHESNFNPHAVSPKGAMGLMQLIPSTAALMGVADPFDPEDNISGGVRYLKQCLARFQNNIIWALAAYNAGPEAVARYQGCPPFAETRTYVLRVMRDYTGVQLDLPVPPQAGGARRGSGPAVSPATASAAVSPPQPSGLAWKIAPPTVHVAKPTWKIPLAPTILANRLPAEVRLHPDVARLLAKKDKRTLLP